MDTYTEHLVAGIATARSNIATDIRSKAGTKRKRNSHEHQDIPWTASRCNRLLRTITSRISILQKLAAANRLNVRSDNNADRKAANSGLDSGHVAQVSEVRVQPSPHKDPEWLPNTAKVSISRTYGGKQSRKRTIAESRSTVSLRQHGGFSIATPFVKRMLRPDLNSSGSDGEASTSTSTVGTRDHRRRRTQKQLPVKPSSSAEEAYNNLVAALGSFLHATRPEQARRRQGSSSLTSTCLRKVPVYIKLQETCAAEASEDEDEHRDLTSEMYVELESYGTASGGGWSGLREVVRADGVDKIRAAIRDNLLPDRVIQALMDVCSKEGAVPEKQQLLAVALENGRSRSMALSRLLSIGEEQECDSFLLRTLGRRVEMNSLFVLELSGYKKLWHILLRAMMREEDRADASAFLHSCLLATCKTSIASSDHTTAHREDLLQDLQSTATLLTAVAAGRPASIGEGADVDDSIGEALQRVAASVLLSCATRNQRCAGEMSVMGGSACWSALSPFLTSSLILQVASSQPRSNMVLLNLEDLVLNLANTTAEPANSTTIAKKTSSRTWQETFISDVALCIGRWDVEAADDFLMEAVTKVLQVAETLPASSEKFLEEFALTNVRAYAESRSDKELLMFAEEVEDMVSHGTRLASLQTPAKRLKAEGYRWEEGLCEWIARTPFSVAAPRAEAIEEKSIMHDDAAAAAFEAREVAKPPLSPAASVTQAGERKSMASHHLPGLPQPKRRPLQPIENTAAMEANTSGTCLLVKQQVKLHSINIQVETENKLRPESGEESADERDELAMSVKKTRSTYHPSSRARVIEGRQPLSSKAVRSRVLARHSSSSSNWDTDCGSEDELGL